MGPSPEGGGGVKERERERERGREEKEEEGVKGREEEEKKRERELRLNAILHNHMTSHMTHWWEIPLPSLHIVLVHLLHEVLAVQEPVAGPEPGVPVSKAPHLHLDNGPALLQPPSLRRDQHNLKTHLQRGMEGLYQSCMDSYIHFMMVFCV